MNKQNPTAGLVACLISSLVFHSTALSAKTATVEERLAQQNALFDEEYETSLKLHPEMATSYGDYRYNDRLDDYSLAGHAAEHELNQKFLARLKAIPDSGFKEQDVLSHQVMQRVLERRLADDDFKEYEMPINQMEGPQADLADLPLSVPLDSVKHYEDYIARLHQIPRVFTQTEEVLRQGKADGLMPVRFLLEKIQAQCEGVIASDPYLEPTKNFPADFSEAERRRFAKEITAVVVKEVLPAYMEFGKFVAEEYAPYGRTTLSVTSLPGGEQRYLNDIHSRTTLTKLTPEQIHQIGLREYERILAEMQEVAHNAGFTDLQAFRASIKANPKYRPTSREQILDDYRRYLAQMESKMPQLFGFLPGSPVTVEPIPDFEPGVATHYQTGTPDGKRPGRIVVAVSKFAERSLIDDEATAYHEGIPGHHMQLSVAQKLPDLPKFRQHGGNSGYVEGWALYSEQLGKDVGFYQDPVSDYGRLSSELFRAVRLVVDTGLHAKGWTRDQVVEFFRKSEAVDEPMLQAETDRYIAWPAQALSYKLGQLKFRELRERARKELGAKFDIRAFHDQMLNGGVLPLDLLESRTNSWIKEQKKKG
jgi:uncharacterized protein (DUF885 family)